MPFTFSHPAIVLPLSKWFKKWVSTTGLIIGSMTPDFEYFVRMKIKSEYSHTLSGVFLFNLPLGIILAFIFHNHAKKMLFENLPAYYKSKFNIYIHFNWNKYFNINFLIVIISVILGAYSHIFWDSFTHHNGFFVTHIPILNNSVILFGHNTYVYKFLQHGSSLIGVIVILLSLIHI